VLGALFLARNLGRNAFISKESIKLPQSLPFKLVWCRAKPDKHRLAKLLPRMDFAEARTPCFRNCFAGVGLNYSSQRAFGDLIINYELQ
jgi:hypothetical protein